MYFVPRVCGIASLMRLSCSPSNKNRIRRCEVKREIGDDIVNGCALGWHSVSVNGFCFRAKDSTSNTLNNANSLEWRWPSEIQHSRVCGKTTISSYIVRDKSRSCQFYGLLGTRVVRTLFPHSRFSLFYYISWRVHAGCNTSNSNLCRCWKRVQIAE